MIGYLDSATLDGLAAAAPELQLESTMVGVFDNRTAHLEGGHKTASNPLQVWPSDWIDDLPDALRNYRAVLWDTEAKTLVVVPMGAFNERTPKMVIRPNVPTKFGQVISVVSLGAVPASELRTKRYVLLVGDIK